MNPRNEDDYVDLHGLLSQPVHEDSWGPIYDYVRSHPHEAAFRYYRNESPLQLALRARERRRGWRSKWGCGSRIADEGRAREGRDIARMDVLQALVDAYPAAIFGRDGEGRTCLHTACSAGRRPEILSWLLEAEERHSCMEREWVSQRQRDGPTPERNVTLRTDYPGGALPLHSIAACPSFDRVASLAELRHPRHPIDTYLLPCCDLNPDMLCAYASTTVIRHAYPRAVWDRDCEGETPLHAAASWGNVGSVLSLLVGAASSERGSFEATRAAIAADDRGKTPLDRACERVCSMCEPGRAPSLAKHSAGDSPLRGDLRSLRGSISREDPFGGSAGGANSSLRRIVAREDPFRASLGGPNSDDWRRSLLHREGSGRQRIPGCGSSFRSSLSSSITRGGVGPFEDFAGLDTTAMGGDESPPPSLRESFISPRRPVEPIRGLEPLDGDGDEEMAKVELLARAAYGFFDAGNAPEDEAYFPLDEVKRGASPAPPPGNAANSSGRFQLLHAVVALGCRPEVVWHAAMRRPHQVAEMDEFGRVPLYLACERLAKLYCRAMDDAIEEEDSPPNGMTSCSGDGNGACQGNTSDSDAVQKFVCSLLLGDDRALLLLDDCRSAVQSTTRPQSPTRPDPPATDCVPQGVGPEEPRSEAPIRDEDLMRRLSMAREVISILLHSPLFGRPEMASVPNGERAEGGRLPLDVVLEAGLQWADGAIRRRGARDGANGPLRLNEDNGNSVVQMLVDAFPQALEVRDGKTGLFPFMIAASSSKVARATGDGENDSCTKHLETVYQLLLRAPTMLS
mmetsp:Transcript_33296/g.70929  ORF Transcript_33296/g.70929 Transcript_33296/m.70929 type:complete len:797 (+) Transcript_33296:166-2556(+)|eukprot:CAMPEP_0172576620 /NCGR_PEP_ID=MMETSP1067-20121228/137810_1 /TAXON_ID=265564 ORGANISM="Thalassiosira punctigera, Strain Tpunct2005C2" /NCGR_SAMPLE_ID=MMETSP1067 /ASSEMBLY_ACC=CAM_ASM_000444 /LENGTH=796 /DNA_ID=CAMNT_0013369295 /DNA_START=149 /DNA_END=2539 /DNA_ORIENTATION=+